MSERHWDAFFAAYFIIHIPILFLFDAQAVLPSCLFPQAMLSATAAYSSYMKDNMVLQPPAWYWSLCFCELTVQAPIILACAYAFVKGGCRWIRLPAIVYGAHVATTLVPILAHIAFHDFSSDSLPGPETPTERLALACVYLPWFVWPAMLTWRMAVSRFYSDSKVHNN